jgi:DNA-binding transcriptional ArsR family regulator
MFRAGSADGLGAGLDICRFVRNHLVMEPSGYGGTTVLDATFHALADPTRRAILARLAAGEASVTELAAPFQMSQPAVSKHLRVLEKAGLIARGRDAQRRPCRLVAQPLRDATAWLADFRLYWEESYQRLDALLGTLQRDSPS